MSSNNSQCSVYNALNNSLWGRFPLNVSRYKSLGIVKTTEELLGHIFCDDEDLEINDVLNSIKSNVVLFSYTEPGYKKLRQTNLMIANYATFN